MVLDGSFMHGSRIQRRQVLAVCCADTHDIWREKGDASAFPVLLLLGLTFLQ
jgi:hypothetical protein